MRWFTWVRRMRTRHGAVAALAILVLTLILVTSHAERDSASAPVSPLPAPVVQSLSQRPVWCVADFQDGWARHVSVGYYPDQALDLALRNSGAERWIMEGAARQYVRCYTSWEAAFYHYDGPTFARPGEALKTVRDWLPTTPNEGDYEIAVLYGFHGDGWQKARSSAFGASIPPQRWALTEADSRTP